MNFLIELDRNIFLSINQLGLPLLDGLMLFLTHRYTWSVAILIFACFTIWRRWRAQLLPVLVMGVVALGIADAFTFQVLKPSFARSRPCHAMADQIRLVQKRCGSDHGFPSNHAANGAAVAAVACLYWRNRYGALVAATAGFVGFTRIYVGVHYPGDLIGGFIVGGSVGSAVYYATKQVPWAPIQNWWPDRAST